MFDKLKNWRVIFVIGLAAIVAMIVLGAGRAVPSVIQVSGDGELIVPRVRIIQFGDTVARFNTVTGEIHRFHGDLDKPNVRGQWVRHVRGVSDTTSGVLQIQRPDGVRAEEAAFLVDAITGDTWLLRRRGAAAEWDRVDIAR